MVLLRDLATTVGAGGDKGAIEKLLTATGNPDVSTDASYAALAGLGQGLARRREKLNERIAMLPVGDRVRLEKQLLQAEVVAADKEVPTGARLQALGLLGFLTWTETRTILVGCLASTEPRDVQLAALRTLGAFNEADIAGELLRRWKQFTPPLRDESVTILLSRPLWHEPLVTALETGANPPTQVSVPHRARLVGLKDEKLAERAKRMLASFALGPRKEVLDRYQAAFALGADAKRGQLVYRRECANCHRLAGEGHDVGPSLETIQHRSPMEILVHVLDPNREVSPQFLDYSVRLTDGRVLAGLIASETDAGLTLRRAEKREDSVLRSEIEEVASSGKSLMPEGLEQKITQQEMADLIEYLRHGPKR